MTKGMRYTMCAINFDRWITVLSFATLAFGLSACSLTQDEVAKKAKIELQTLLESDEALRKYELTVLETKVVEDSKNRYVGSLTVTDKLGQKREATFFAEVEHRKLRFTSSGLHDLLDCPSSVDVPSFRPCDYFLLKARDSDEAAAALVAQLISLGQFTATNYIVLGAPPTLAKNGKPNKATFMVRLGRFDLASALSLQAQMKEHEVEFFKVSSSPK